VSIAVSNHRKVELEFCCDFVPIHGGVSQVAVTFLEAVRVCGRLLYRA